MAPRTHRDDSRGPLGAPLRRLAARGRSWLSLERSPLGPPRLLVTFLVVFIAGMAVVTLVGDQGLLAYRQLHAERDRLRAEVARLEARRLELEQTLHALRTDPDYIEQLARRELGLARPGEVIVQVPPLDTEE